MRWRTATTALTARLPASWSSRAVMFGAMTCSRFLVYTIRKLETLVGCQSFWRPPGNCSSRIPCRAIWLHYCFADHAIVSRGRLVE